MARKLPGGAPIHLEYLTLTVKFDRVQPRHDKSDLDRKASEQKPGPKRP
jgi:hypothetical protein